MLKDWRFLLIGIGIVAAAVFCGFLFMGDSQPVYAGDGTVANHSAITPVPSGEEMQFVSSGPTAQPVSSAVIWTDKADYAPNEVPIIFGAGFEASTEIAITVIDPAGTIYSGSTLSDVNGQFAVAFAPESGLMLGQYTVTASDGVNVAQTTFTDGDYSNHHGGGHGGGPSKYSVKFDASGLGSNCTGAILQVKIGGNSWQDVSTVPYTFSNISSGTQIQYQYYSPIDTTDSGMRYVWTSTSGTGSASGMTGQSGSFNLTSNSTVTGTYKTQYYLTVNNGGHGTATGEGWYDAGSTAGFSISGSPESGGTGVQYVFSNWNGSGTGSYSGTSISSSVTMNNPITETAVWTTQYYLTVNNGGHGTATGEGWYDAGSTAGFSIGPTTIDLGGGYYWQFTGWSGSGSGTFYTGNANPGSVTMDGPITETAVWVYNAPTAGAFTGTNPALVIAVDTNGLMLRYPVNEQGALLVNVVQKSLDGLLIVEIPVGTIVLNPDGTPAYLNKDPDVLGIIAATPPAPPGSKLIRAYRMLPKGLTFKVHNMTIAGIYDPAEVPAGARVIWAYYDEASGKWVDMETAGYVAGGYSMANTVASQTSHFTYFALIAK